MTTVPLFDNDCDVLMHIAVLMRLAMADGRFLPSERKYIEDLAEVYAQTHTSCSFERLTERIGQLSEHDQTDWCKSLASRPVKAKNLVKDLVTLGNIDGDFCLEERNLVYEISASFGLDKSTVDDIARAVLDVMASSLRLNALIYSE